jgi:hypothetical protein
VYFTFDGEQAGRREQLERCGFTVVDTGVYRCSRWRVDDAGLGVLKLAQQV